MIPTMMPTRVPVLILSVSSLASFVASSAFFSFGCELAGAGDAVDWGCSMDVSSEGCGAGVSLPPLPSLGEGSGALVGGVFVSGVSEDGCGDGDGDGDGDSDDDGDGVGDGEGEGEGDGEGSGVGDGPGVGEGSGVGEGDG